MNMSRYSESGLKAPRGVELCCPLCCSPEKETWSDYSQNCSSVIFGSATGEGEDETGKEKNGTDDVAKTWASWSKMTKMTNISDIVTDCDVQCAHC